ncbi:MAG: pyridoxal 5'-phosphate synthase glutaminase subunit PdxT [Candidatus Thermoplasmatota archaeon]|nr:pyridoxal 5'-phosphate synthase glutaminase subunit PdxT [Candidatus Thermoplasmatota archaeon]
MPLRIAVVGLQGDVQEHISATRSALSASDIDGEAFQARSRRDLEDADAAIIPGGESTTISKLLHRSGMDGDIERMASEGRPILGTCAGCVLLASAGDEQVRRTGTELLDLMDMEVSRNAFGSQRESFETDLHIDGIGMFRGVFIRAPLITRVWGRCSPMGHLGDSVVLARQNNLLAASFHPELSGDLRLHSLFLGMIKE